MSHVLDHPAWFALSGPLARFALGSGVARRSSPEHAVFSAIDPTAPPALAAVDLAALIGEDETAVLVAHDPAVPAGFVEFGRGVALQMVLEDADTMRAAVQRVRDRAIANGWPHMGVQLLSVDDVADMLALIDHARPGPFLSRTIELGRYVGVRVDEALVAMAGERLHLDDYVEISAVSTHADLRRRGLAQLVVADVAEAALARGVTPFLHVVTTNVGAIPVYEQLGFVTRTTVSFVACRRVLA